MTRRFWLAGASVLLLIVGLTTWRLVAARPSGPDNASTRCTPARPVPGGAAADAAPAGGGLRVVEQGFTQIDGNGKVVSVGAVVENASTAVAYRTPVHIKVFDASHNRASADAGGLLSQVIPVLMPGERIGVGAWAYLRSDAVTGAVTAVASVELELGPSQWFAPDDSAVFFAAITSTHKHTQLTTTGGPAYGSIAFTADSPYCQSISDRGVARSSATARSDHRRQPGRGVPARMRTRAGRQVRDGHRRHTGRLRRRTHQSLPLLRPVTDAPTVDDERPAGQLTTTIGVEVSNTLSSCSVRMRINRRDSWFQCGFGCPREVAMRPNVSMVVR